MKISYPGRLFIINTTFTVVVLIIICTITGCNALEEDFTGGTEWILQVDTDQAVRSMTFEARGRLKDLLKESNVDLSTASLKDEHTIEISGLKPEDETNVKQILVDNFTGWDFQFSGENASLTLKQGAVNQVKEQAILQTVAVMKKRLFALGLSENYIQRETPGSDRLKLRLPPDKHPNRVIGVIRMGGILEFRSVIDGPFFAKEEALNTYNGTLPEELNILQTNPRGREKGFYVVKAYPVIGPRDLEKVRRSTDQWGGPTVEFTLNPAGAAKFRNYTSKNIGKKLAIVLDNYIESAPVIQATLFDKAVIIGNFTIEEAEDLARVLNSGGLPAPIKILEEKTIEANE